MTELQIPNGGGVVVVGTGEKVGTILISKLGIWGKVGR